MEVVVCLPLGDGESGDLISLYKAHLPLPLLFLTIQFLSPHTYRLVSGSGNKPIVVHPLNTPDNATMLLFLVQLTGVRDQ